MTAFSDDFNRPNSSDLGAGWVEVSGDWSIVTNQLSPGSSGGTIILRAATAMASNDNFAQVTIAATTTASQGVWCRGNANISNGYLWRNSGTSWDLFAVVGGSFLNIGTYAAAAAPGDVAKVQAVGTTIKGFVNGIQRVSVTNTDVSTGTSVGIRAESVSGLRFDDFSAADVTAGATLPVASATATAQTLASSKAAPLAPAGATSAAQPVTGSKAGALGAAGMTEAAQALAGAKTATLSPAGAVGTAQVLAGAKTSLVGSTGTTETAHSVVGGKTAALGAAAERPAVQALTGAVRAVLVPAAVREQAQLLTVDGPVAPPGPDIDVTVGTLYSPWSAGPVRTGGWEVGAPW
ncbi:hypothetical protein MUK60_07355 [Streptomyces sp. LRE541]|uniref:hypothetical protein n=1 Tax=Streptomyces sp. LRE541 TaxID=2931983 RepID=UPI0020106536|nr:hypothetical protein [Streptomyces sp. LRE541]UPZ27649.1 hypothetical protein MUK60_07355 [Streptomyces sp. LRE541]